MQNTRIAEQLEDLKGETGALWSMAYRLNEQVREALAKIKTPPDGAARREIALDYMRDASNAQLRADLRKVRGTRSAACLRTKMNSDLEALAGRRHPVNGSARVHGNGNGATAL